MTGASLVLFAVLGQAPTANPFDLIRQLGAAHYAERQSASASLERLGRLALPALRTAREQKDPEIRARAAALLGRIEGALLTQASLVTLDFQKTPIQEAVRSFSEQSGVKLVLRDDNGQNWKDHNVTLHETTPLTFWKALDRFCDAAHLQYNFGMHTMQNGGEPVFPLFEGGIRPSAPVSDFGPFRVSVVTIRYQSDVSFPGVPQFQPDRQNPAPGVPAGRQVHVNEQFFAQMQIAVEPRLSLTQNAPLKITEAIDDRGNRLAGDSAAATELRRSGYFGYANGPVIPLQAFLHHPAQPGKRIKVLKGVVPITVSTRKPDPLRVSLGAATGRTVQNEDVVITVHEVHVQPGHQPPTLDLTIRQIGPETAGLEGAILRPDVHQQHLEILSAEGRPIPWYQSSLDTESGRLTVSLALSDPAIVPSELRYYSLIRANTEVPFAFTDIPMR